MRWILTSFAPRADDDEEAPLRAPLLPDGAALVTFWHSQGDPRRVLALVGEDAPLDLAGLDVEDLTEAFADAATRDAVGSEFGLAVGWDPASFADHPRSR